MNIRYTIPSVNSNDFEHATNSKCSLDKCYALKGGTNKRVILKPSQNEFPLDYSRTNYAVLCSVIRRYSIKDSHNPALTKGKPRFLLNPSAPNILQSILFNSPNIYWAFIYFLLLGAVAHWNMKECLTTSLKINRRYI